MGDELTIAFVVDEPRWAFDQWTAALASELSGAGLVVKRYFRKTLPVRIEEAFVFVCWWPDVELVTSRITSTQSILCRVTDMVTWNHHAPELWQDRFRRLIPAVHCYFASSKEIELELHAMGLHNVARLGDCVDPRRFHGKKYNLVEKPVVGWCGNPRALEWMGFVDTKGFSVIQSLRDNRHTTLKIAVDVPPEKMPQWYRDIDIYVCASRFEGTPLPVLEAMATGNIVVSTAVGIVPEIQSPGVHLFDGSVPGLHAAVDAAICARSQWSQMGATNRQHISDHWSPAAIATTLIMRVSSAVRPLCRKAKHERR